jgi:3-isopropylmalate/(R)-2-methylmalate dehydratase small subunit
MDSRPAAAFKLGDAGGRFCSGSLGGAGATNELSGAPPGFILPPDMSKFTGPVYVVRDNIDTDQIIPAQFLNLVPTIAEEYEKLGSYALNGLPNNLYPTRFVQEGAMDTEYPIVIAGRNFGCGSSREHAPIALGAANCECVVAESFARIYFRNCIATGEVYPIECTERLCDTFKTGDLAEVDIDAGTIRHVATGKTYSLKPLGEVRPVIDAGGIFDYARKNGMMPQAV